MQAIQINFTVSMNVVRYVGIRDHEDPNEIYNLLFSESSEDEYADLVDKLVVSDIEQAVYGADNVCAEIRSSRDICYMTDGISPDSKFPYWETLVDSDHLRRIKHDKRMQEIRDELSSLVWGESDDYDRIIELVNQLKAIDNE